MKKKLILNKVTIAQLTNPDRIFGGEGDAAQIPHTAGGNATCDGGATCYNVTTCYGVAGETKTKHEWACYDPISEEVCVTNPPTYLP